MANEGPDVEADPGGFEAGKPGGQIGTGAAAVAGDDGGNALVEEVGGLGIEFNCAFDVGVDVDEAGGEDAVFGVDGLVGCLGGKVADGGDAARFDAEVGAEPGVSGAVDDAGIADEQIKISCAGGEGQAEEESQTQGGMPSFGLRGRGRSGKRWRGSP